jgi:hypothetical protein
MIIALGLYWSKLFEALLVLVAIFQFELSYRQHWFNKMRDEPAFAVFSSKQSDGSILISIRNTGPTSAYLVGVSRVICNGAPLSPEEWSSYVKALKLPCLPPSTDSPTLAIINENFYEGCLVKKHCAMEVLYVNKYSEWKSFLVGFHELMPIIITKEERPPGFFLSVGDDLAIVKSLIALRRLRRIYW